MRRACPFCGSGENRIIPVEDSWTGEENVRVVCNTCDAMGTPGKDEKQAERFWNGVLAKSDDAFNRYIGESWGDDDPKTAYLRNKWEKQMDSPHNDYIPFQEWLDEYGEFYGKKFDRELDEMDAGAPAAFTGVGSNPGMGNAQPASTAAMTGAQQTSSDAIGSGDKWGDSSTGKLHTQATNEGFRSKQFKGMRGWVDDWYKERRGMYQYSDTKGPEFHEEKLKNGKIISGFLEKFYPYDYYQKPDEINPYNDKPNKEPVELFLIPLFKKGMFKIVDLEKNTVLADKKRLEYETDDEDIGFMIGGWSGPTVFEQNLNPYDKIGMMMAKKLGVEPPFKQGDSRTNTIKQNHWDELDEDQEKDPESIDDYVKDPDKVHREAKKRKVANEGKFELETLDSYLKASKHVPDHPLTLVKKKMIKEEDLRTAEVTKDEKGKEALERLGIANEFKPAKSGKNRTFIKEPMKDVLLKLKEGGWEEYGKNPENTIRKYMKGDQVLTIYADGKDLPRATLTPKPQEEAKEHYVLRKVAPESLKPYLKS